MKSIHKTIAIVLFFAVMPWGQMQGQDSTDNETVIQHDTTEISWRKKKFVIISDDDGTRFKVQDNDEYDHRPRSRKNYSHVGFLAFDFGINNYYQDGNFGEDALTDPRLEVKTFRPFSHVALHFLPTTTSLIGRGTVNIQSALTIDYNNYYFVNDITLQPNQDVLTISDSSGNFELNKLFVRYAQIPLMLNFNTSPRREDGLSFSIGGYAGVMWKARTKQKSANGGKVKISDEFNLNQFRYGLTARLNFKWFRFYTNYNLSSLFANDEGPNTQTFSAGFILADFHSWD